MFAVHGHKIIMKVHAIELLDLEVTEKQLRLLFQTVSIQGIT